MKLDLRAVRINKCTFENNMGPNMKLNLPISTNNQIKLPKEFRKGSVGTIITKIMVGSPMHPLYIHLEQITSFMDSEATDTTCENLDTMMSLFKTICVPLAMQELEKTIKQLCQVYRIPEIKLQKAPQHNTNQYLN